MEKISEILFALLVALVCYLLSQPCRCAQGKFALLFVLLLAIILGIVDAVFYLTGCFGVQACEAADV
jgi:hypothetical protein